MQQIPANSTEYCKHCSDKNVSVAKKRAYDKIFNNIYHLSNQHPQGQLLKQLYSTPRALKDTVMNFNFITILCSIIVYLMLVRYLSAEPYRHYFHYFLGPIALSWAFPCWHHRHFSFNLVY